MQFLHCTPLFDHVKLHLWPICTMQYCILHQSSFCCSAARHTIVFKRFLLPQSRRAPLTHFESTQLFHIASQNECMKLAASNSWVIFYTIPVAMVRVHFIQSNCFYRAQENSHEQHEWEPLTFESVLGSLLGEPIERINIA